MKEEAKYGEEIKVIASELSTITGQDWQAKLNESSWCASGLIKWGEFELHIRNDKKNRWLIGGIYPLIRDNKYIHHMTVERPSITTALGNPGATAKAIHRRLLPGYFAAWREAKSYAHWSAYDDMTNEFTKKACDILGTVPVPHSPHSFFGYRKGQPFSVRGQVNGETMRVELDGPSDKMLAILQTLKTL